jgi:hypothetical protein
MRRIAIAAWLWLVAVPAWAGVPCTLPFNLQNGTTADATQVMANYNALVNCLTLAAAAGVNSDITALTGLTTPLPPTEGGTSFYIGGTSSGSANAQVISSVTPTFTLQAGSKVSFTAGFSNSGPLQINVASTGLLNVYRHSQFGATLTVGGEVVAGQRVVLEYDGAQWQCISCAVARVGEEVTFTGASVPAGYQIEDGSCISQSTYADLFGYYGSSDLWLTQTGGVACSAGLFHVPFANGRLSMAANNQGAGSGPFVACAAGLTINCGATESITLSQGNLPNVNFLVTGTTLNNGILEAELCNATAGQCVGGGSTAIAYDTAAQGSFGGLPSSTSNVTVTSGGSAASGGSSVPFSIVNYNYQTLKAVKL